MTVRPPTWAYQYLYSPTRSFYSTISHQPSPVTSRLKAAGLHGYDDPELQVRMDQCFGICYDLGHQIHREEGY